MPPIAPTTKAEPMSLRTLRVPRELWDAAATKAASEDPPRGVTELVRDLLELYRAGAIKGRKR